MQTNSETEDGLQETTSLWGYVRQPNRHVKVLSEDEDHLMSEMDTSNYMKTRPRTANYRFWNIGVAAVISAVFGSSAVSPNLAMAASSHRLKHASIKWAFAPNAIDANTHPILSYSATKSAPSDLIVIQKQYGGVWRDVARLHSMGGTYQAAAVLQGEYNFRMEIRSNLGKMLAKEIKPLYVYADVPLTEFAGTGSGGTVVVGQNLFVYVATDSYGGDFLKILNSTCRSVNLQVAYVKGPYFTPSPSATLTAVTTVADPVVLTLISGTSGVIQTTMSKDITVQMSAIDGDGGDTAYMAGTLNCYTTTGMNQTG
jgi:hypothetical protein